MATQTTTPKYDVVVQLTGQDGNAFAILAKVTKAITSAGGSSEDADAFFKEATAGNYDQLLQTVMRWVKVK